MYEFVKRDKSRALPFSYFFQINFLKLHFNVTIGPTIIPIYLWFPYLFPCIFNFPIIT